MAATESSTRAMAALDDLYRRHVGDVYRYTYAVLGNHADAEDVTQTTFVNALRALERGEVPREPSHWLLAIAHNLVRQRWRQAAARPTMVELVHDVPDEPGEEDIQLDELVKALQRIPPSQREALVMRELEGRSYKEIAELLGLTTSALETLLFRARRSLAEELENLVTCQDAELALSRDSDGRLSRKERKRLDEHIAECPSCARFSRTTAQQRKAFKGLALLPLPVGLALFKETPAAAAATVTTLGEGGVTTGAGIGTGSGAATGGSAAGGSITVGGTVASGSILGGAAVKIAAIVAAATVAVGVGYQGVKTLGADAPESTTAAGTPLAKVGASAMATATPGAGGTAAASGSPGSTLPTVPVSGGSTAGPKAILPADPHADAPTAGSPAGDTPTSGGTSSPDTGAAPAPGGSPGSSPGGDAPGGGAGGGTAPGAPPPGGDPGGTPPAGGGDGPTGAQPPGTAPSQPPTTAPTPRAPAPTTGPKGKAKGKGKPKKAKTPPKGKPTTTPPRGKPTTTPSTGTPTTSPPKAKDPKANPTAGTTPGGGTEPKEPKAPKEPKNDSTPVAPPETQPTTPPASAPPTETTPTPTGDGGSSAPDNGNRGKGADQPGKS
jgi:RNA polymerase sigma factor (sigma-70 family)